MRNVFRQVTVVQAAAGREAGLLVLHRSHSNGTSSAPPDDPAAILAAETVACVRVDQIVPRERRIDLIKADVEGAEYLALGGCLGIIRRDRPVIVTEFSPGLKQGISGVSGPEYLAWLIDQGYSLAVVQPDGALTSASPAAIMSAYAARSTDHLDLVAQPIQPAKRWQRRLDSLLARLRRRR